MDDESIGIGDESAAPGISRRSALKRIGAGAAIAWSAPVILSMGSRAFAASGSAVPCSVPPSDTDCAQAVVNPGNFNNVLQGCNGHTSDVCFQACDPSGVVHCAQRVDCTSIDCGPTGSNGVCASGVCVRTCCPEFEGKPRFECLPAC